MADESIFSDGLDPTILDGDTGIKTISNRFTVSEARPAVAGRIYVRTGGLPSTALWQLWNEDTATKLAELDMNAELSSPTPNQFSDWVTLPTPVDLSPGVSYLVARHLAGAPGYEYSDGVPAPFPVGTAPLSATTGVYQNGGGPSVMPSSVYAAYFFADLKLGDVAADPAEGTSDPSLTLTLAASGKADHDAAAAFATTLSLAASGQADHDGAAPTGITLALAATGQAGHDGTAAAGIALALAASGSADHESTAVAGITLTLAATGSRDAQGASATGTALTISATGSNSSGLILRPDDGLTYRPDLGLILRP